MFAEILKIVLPFLGGGLAGALLNEWFADGAASFNRFR
jgi:hypothetical protein